MRFAAHHSMVIKFCSLQSWKFKSWPPWSRLTTSAAVTAAEDRRQLSLFKNTTRLLGSQPKTVHLIPKKCVCGSERERERERGNKQTLQRGSHVQVCLHVPAWKKKNCTTTVCVWGCAVCCGCAEQWSIFSHYPTAYVWFIYIHGYPDNEAFNPGDPVVRTMNPITSCRLWDGMADSETDGRGCTRPAIQSHSSRLLPVSPRSCVLQQLINRQGPKNLRSLHHTHQQSCKHTHTHSLRSTRSLQSPAPPFPTTNMHLRFLCTVKYNVDLKSSHTSPAGGGEGGKERVLWAR